MLEARMTRLWLGVLTVVALGALVVAWLVARPSAAKGYSGLEFTQVTNAAAARAPLLTSRGALIEAVADKSPAYRAGIKAGAVPRHIIEESNEDLAEALSIDHDEWKREVLLQDELFFKLYADLPKELILQKELLISRM